ncbi:MAG: T9SS type A sorting domain-containing protein [Bacteroidales bacterium]|nr:T9SS type A sorting domain-containing protein [Bacteroidales bacterium]
MKTNSRVLFFTALTAFCWISFSTAAQSIQDQLGDDIFCVVAQDGSGDYLTIQEAVNAIPDNNPTRKVIYIKNGNYYEKVVVPVTKTNLTMVGEDMDSTVLVYDDSPAKGAAYWTMNTSTIRIDADDFWALNMTISNSAGNTGQALALYGNGDRQVYTHCRILGYQDTYYITARVRNYFKDCFIEGATDYIFGFGVAVFDSCQIHSLPGGYITAASTPLDYKFGLVFRDCSLTTSPNGTGVSLGRPWFDYARTVFMKCWETKGIIAGGWSPWGGREATCYYREYQCFGPGSDTTKRVSYGKQLTDQEAEKYVLDTIFALSNFPIDAVHDTAEIFVPYRRFASNPAVPDPGLFFKAGKDTFPGYPSADWKVDVEQDSIYQIIKNNTYRVLDSINGEYSIQGLLYNDTPIAGFDLSVTLYGIELEENDTVPPVITAVTQDALVFVKYPSKLPGYTTVTVTSKNKQYQSLFMIYNSVDSAFWNTDLRFITYNAGKDTIKILPGVYEYDVALPGGTTSPPSLTPWIVIAGTTYKISQPASLPGTAVIKVIAIDTSTKQDYLIHYTVMSGLDNNEADEGVSVLQNPFHELITVMVNTDKPASLRFYLYDISGRLVLSKECVVKGYTNLEINSPGLPKGIYTYSIQMDSKIITGKLIKVERK